MSTSISLRPRTPSFSRVTSTYASSPAIASAEPRGQALVLRGCDQLVATDEEFPGERVVARSRECLVAQQLSRPGHLRQCTVAWNSAQHIDKRHARSLAAQ